MISGKKDGNIFVEKQFVRTGDSIGVTVIARNVFGLPNTDLISRLVREKISLRPF